MCTLALLVVCGPIFYSFIFFSLNSCHWSRVLVQIRPRNKTCSLLLSFVRHAKTCRRRQSKGTGDFASFFCGCPSCSCSCSCCSSCNLSSCVIPQRSATCNAALDASSSCPLCVSGCLALAPVAAASAAANAACNCGGILALAAAAAAATAASRACRTASPPTSKRA